MRGGQNKTQTTHETNQRKFRNESNEKKEERLKLQADRIAHRSGNQRTTQQNWSGTNAATLGSAGDSEQTAAERQRDACRGSLRASFSAARRIPECLPMLPDWCLTRVPACNQSASEPLPRSVRARWYAVNSFSNVS